MYARVPKGRAEATQHYLLALRSRNDKAADQDIGIGSDRRAGGEIEQLCRRREGGRKLGGVASGIRCRRGKNGTARVRCKTYIKGGITVCVSGDIKRRHMDLALTETGRTSLAANKQCQPESRVRSAIEGSSNSRKGSAVGATGKSRYRIDQRRILKSVRSGVGVARVVRSRGIVAKVDPELCISKNRIMRDLIAPAFVAAGHDHSGAVVGNRITGRRDASRSADQII